MRGKDLSRMETRHSEIEKGQTTQHNRYNEKGEWTGGEIRFFANTNDVKLPLVRSPLYVRVLLPDMAVARVRDTESATAN